MIYLSRGKCYSNVSNMPILPGEYRGGSAAVLFLVLLQTVTGRVASGSGLIDQSPGTIIFLFSGFAANPIHLVNAGSIVLRRGIIEGP
jgi:hypothetical protein